MILDPDCRPTPTQWMLCDRHASGVLCLQSVPSSVDIPQRFYIWDTMSNNPKPVIRGRVIWTTFLMLQAICINDLKKKKKFWNRSLVCVSAGIAVMMWSTFIVKRFSAAAFLMDKVTRLTHSLTYWFIKQACLPVPKTMKWLEPCPLLSWDTAGHSCTQWDGTHSI